MKYSDDARSAEKGGKLPTFGVGMMLRPFEEVAFGLEKDGDISKPFQTQYGWHIVKRLKIDKMGTYEQIEPMIDQKVKKDSRSKLGVTAVVRNIKTQYGFTENLKERDDFYKVMDSSYFIGGWNKTKAEGLDAVMFTIGDKKVTQADFTQHLFETQRGSRPIDIRALVNDRYRLYKESTLLDYKDERLEDEYPDFKALVQEYHDGILLFNLTDDVVWKKASEDSLGLDNYYQKNKENYRWGKRAEAVVYNFKDQEVADQVKSLIAKGLEADSIMKVINESSQLNLRYEKKFYEEGSNEMVDETTWKKGTVQEFPKNGRVDIVQIIDVLKPGYKQLSEARGLVISDYQEELEQNWIKALREEYSYTINQELLEQLKQNHNQDDYCKLILHRLFAHFMQIFSGRQYRECYCKSRREVSLLRGY